MKRRPVILLILAILLLTALWLGRGWWLPFFQSWLPQLAGDIGNQIQSIEAFVGLLVLIGGGLWGLWAWFTREESANQRADELTPLKATNWQTIRARSPQGARIPWIDRGATDANDLRAQPRLALIGLSGEGKTREAAELIRRAVELELVVESQVFEPNRDFLHTGAAITSSVLDKVVEPTQRAALFIDDLHSYSATTLDQLATLLALFTHPQLDHRYEIATVRSDLVSPEQSAWLTQQGFQSVRLPKIDDRQAEQWLTSAGQFHGLTLSKKVRQTFIKQNRQKMPGNLLRGFLTVKSTLADNAKGRDQIKVEQVVTVMSNLDAQERQTLYRRKPLATYLLTALAHFHAAGVRTAQPLLLAYATTLHRREHNAGRWLSWRAGRTLRRTLVYLANFDVSIQDGLIIEPDVLIESTDTVAARQGVGEFLVAYRRPFHNRLLRRLHRHARVHRWAIFDLAFTYQQKQEYSAAARFYTAAIQVEPHSWCYNNRGIARKAQGDLPAAIEDYNQAISLNPQFAMAYNNRGIARYAQGQLTATIVSQKSFVPHLPLGRWDKTFLESYIVEYDYAITLTPQDAAAFSNRGPARNTEGKVAAPTADYNINRSSARADQGLLAEAIADYDQAIVLNPQFAMAYYNNRGLARYAQGDLTTAIADYDQAIVLNPQFAMAYCNRGLIRYAQGDLTTAIADYDQAIVFNPQFAMAYCNRGSARYAQGQLTAAIVDYDCAITLNPQDAAVFGNSGPAHNTQGKVAAPTADYNIALNTQNVTVYYNRGSAGADQGLLAEAIADYDQAIILNPQFAMAYYNRGLIRYAQGDLTTAIADYDQAIVLNPQFAMAYYNRGSAHQTQGDLTTAIADYDQAIVLNPQFAMAYNNRGIARYAQGDLTTAIADYDQAIVLNPQFTMAYCNRGLIRYAQGDLTTAIADYDQAIVLNPQFAMAYCNRGLARYAQGDLTTAIADYDQAIVLNPQFAMAYCNRGIARYAQGDLTTAIADYDQAIVLNPQFAMAYNNRGIARYAQGDLTTAIADYDQAIVFNPQFAMAYCNRGIARYAQGDLTTAIADYDQAIVFNPQFTMAYCNRGIACYDRGDLSAAIENYSQAIVRNPQFATAYYNRGNAHKAQDDLAAAIEDYNRVIALNPQYAMAYYNRGLARADQDDLAAASQDYQKALEMNSQLPNQGLRVYRSLGAALREQAQWQEAMITYRQVLALDDSRLADWLALADAAHHTGDEANWLEAIAQARRRVQEGDAYNLACIESVAGNREAAVAALAQAAQEPDFDPAHARRDPDLAWLRTDPRFAEIVGKMIEREGIDMGELAQAAEEEQGTGSELTSGSRM